jgi:signal transduction histidine kinase
LIRSTAIKRPFLTSGSPKAGEPSAAILGAPQNSEMFAPKDMVSALRTISYGGIDDNTRNLHLSPQVRAAVSPVVTAMRWTAVMYGMIFGTAQVFKGSYAVVATLTVALFITSWRTMIPIRLGSTITIHQVVALTDVMLFGLAVGYSGGASSPYVFCVIAATTVAAFGWGYRAAIGSLLIAWSTMVLGNQLSSEAPGFRLSSQVGLIVLTMTTIALLAAFTRNRLLEAEQRRMGLAGRVDTLTETNDLLTMLNAVARTLPTSLSQRDALEGARNQIVETFRGNVICLMELDEVHGEWLPKLSEGCTLRSAASTDELPVHLRQAIDANDTWLVADLNEGSLRGIAEGSGSGIYTRLTARGRVVGVLGIEHPTPGQFGERDSRLLAGLADVVALTLDNARWFGRLRSLGAEEERIRIARDLHDRLGQWLTYISFELERIIGDEDRPAPELSQLYTDVQTALDELRETLRQLRAEVNEQRPLAQVGQELVQRFADRTDIDVRFETINPGETLPVPVENELLRILQESLNNIDKHAKASEVLVSWDAMHGNGVLTIQDNGRGFDADQAVRESAYGLIGMRERTDVIGGHLNIESNPGQGTKITVTAGALPATIDNA